MGKNYTKTQERLVGPAVGANIKTLLKIDFDHFLHWVPFEYWLKRPIEYIVNFLYAPFNWYESLKYGKKIREQELTDDPVFILGHWRSGTTHLHNLLAQDPLLGYTTQKQCLFPNGFLSNPLAKFFLKNFMPTTRPMDNVTMNLETPQEEEMATANTMVYSFYNSWAYPKSTLKTYEKYVRFNGQEELHRKRWQKGYLKVLKKASFYHPGRRLVLKSPANTGRIPAILELFPNAKFIHIYRHPVNVFYSTRKLYNTAMPQMAHQRLNQAECDEIIIRVYDKMMHSYFEERKLIPEENLVEVRYEDLEKDRFGMLEEIYQKFGLGGWDTAEKNIKSYLDNLGTYKKNKHQFTEEECSLVQEKWGFAFEELGYGPQP